MSNEPHFLTLEHFYLRTHKENLWDTHRMFPKCALESISSQIGKMSVNIPNKVNVENNSKLSQQMGRPSARHLGHITF